MRTSITIGHLPSGASVVVWTVVVLVVMLDVVAGAGDVLACTAQEPEAAIRVSIVCRSFRAKEKPETPLVL